MKSNQTSAIQWKQMRERAGLTQREVSDSLGYSTPQFISNVERGRCRFPIQKLPKIKKLYRLSTDQMVNLIMGEEKQALYKIFKKR